MSRPSPQAAEEAIEPFPPSPSPEAAFELIRTEGRSRILLTCDHASNAVPEDLGDLGLGQEDLGRHIAYDVGARGVTLALSALLDAPAALSTFSRLVIDPNRGEDDPTVLMRLYDRTIIPGNAYADAGERERRLARYHRPYHQALDASIDAAEARLADLGVKPLLVAVHSFTPQLRGRDPRPWQLGVLFEKDRASARFLVDSLRAETDLSVGENEPYHGALMGDSMWRHGAQRRLPHILIEIRNDLIATEAQQRAWAVRLAPHLQALADAPSAPFSP